MPKCTTSPPVSDRAGDAARPGIAPTRRGLATLGAGLAVSLLDGCSDDRKWHAIDVSNSSPPLAFTLTRARDGKVVTAADYRGHITMLYFGYTFCPDVCPTTLANVVTILGKIGSAGSGIRLLFVTVDPNRDTPKVLAQYVHNFSPQFDGLRGTPDQLAAVARRYRVVYSVTPATTEHPYEVTHGSAIYVFDGTGAARLLVPSLANAKPDIAGTAADLKRLATEHSDSGLFSRLRRMV
ncbi:MAG: SCO family protein [Stellaceae bacterium]